MRREPNELAPGTPVRRVVARDDKLFGTKRKRTDDSQYATLPRHVQVHVRTFTGAQTDRRLKSTGTGFMRLLQGIDTSTRDRPREVR
jgi:hypothetical protein